MKTVWIMVGVFLAQGCAPSHRKSHDITSRQGQLGLFDANQWNMQGEAALWTADAQAFVVKDGAVSCQAAIGRVGEFAYQRESRTLAQRSVCEDTVTLQLDRVETNALEGALRELASVTAVAKSPAADCQPATHDAPATLYAINYANGSTKAWPASPSPCGSREIIVGWEGPLTLMRQFWRASQP